MIFPNLPMLNMLLALLITLALMLGLALVLRTFSPLAAATGGKRLRKLESLNITPQHALHVVEADGIERLILTSPHTATELTLSSQPAPPTKPQRKAKA